MLKKKLSLLRIVFFCCFLFLGSAHSQLTGASSLSENTWVRRFPFYVGGTAYSLKSQDGDGSLVVAEDVLISLSSPSSPCQTQLVRFSDGSQFGTGTVVFFEKMDKENRQPKTGSGQLCDLKAKAEQVVGGAMLPKCERDSRSGEVGYLIRRGQQAATCIYRLTDMPSVKQLKMDNQPIDSYGSSIYLNRGIVAQDLSSVFGTAPWPRAMADAGFQPCNDYNGFLVAHTTASSGSATKSVDESFKLPHSALKWSALYLVKIEEGYRCGDGVRYRIDPVNTVLAYLSDNTALLKGNRSVLRVRLQDGATTKAQYVRNIESERFFSDLRVDGGRDCVEPDAPYGEEHCKWLASQNWYAYFKTQQKSPLWNPEKDTTYYRKWYQGFDTAIDQIFFSNRE